MLLTEGHTVVNLGIIHKTNGSYAWPDYGTMDISCWLLPGPSWLFRGNRTLGIHICHRSDRIYESPHAALGILIHVQG
mgnify:CR=1 FL=1